MWIRQIFLFPAVRYPTIESPTLQWAHVISFISIGVCIIYGETALYLKLLHWAGPHNIPITAIFQTYGFIHYVVDQFAQGVPPVPTKPPISVGVWSRVLLTCTHSPHTLIVLTSKSKFSCSDFSSDSVRRDESIFS